MRPREASFDSPFFGIFAFRLVGQAGGGLASEYLPQYGWPALGCTGLLPCLGLCLACLAEMAGGGRRCRQAEEEE